MLGEKLRELRKQNSVTQAKLANYLNDKAFTVHSVQCTGIGMIQLCNKCFA